MPRDQRIQSVGSYRVEFYADFSDQARKVRYRFLFVFIFQFSSRFILTRIGESLPTAARPVAALYQKRRRLPDEYKSRFATNSYTYQWREPSTFLEYGSAE